MGFVRKIFGKNKKLGSALKAVATGKAPVSEQSVAAEKRRKIRRPRGRSQTILTSGRGLKQKEDIHRKTLLGGESETLG